MESETNTAMEFADLVAYLKAKYHPKAILLHGSHVRGVLLTQAITIWL